jgi:hypothetical protein
MVGILLHHLLELADGSKSVTLLHLCQTKFVGRGRTVVGACGQRAQQQGQDETPA